MHLGKSYRAQFRLNPFLFVREFQPSGYRVAKYLLSRHHNHIVLKYQISSGLQSLINALGCANLGVAKFWGPKLEGNFGF